MPPKTTIALDLVLRDIQPTLLGLRERYRVVHRNGTTIEGKVVAISDEAVRFKDSHLGLVEIEKRHIARIDKAVPDARRQRFLTVGIVALAMATSGLIAYLLKPTADRGLNLVVFGAFLIAIFSVPALRLALHSWFSTWEPVYPPPATEVMDEEGGL